VPPNWVCLLVITILITVQATDGFSVEAETQRRLPHISFSRAGPRFCENNPFAPMTFRKKQFFRLVEPQVRGVTSKAGYTSRGMVIEWSSIWVLAIYHNSRTVNCAYIEDIT